MVERSRERERLRKFFANEMHSDKELSKIEPNIKKNWTEKIHKFQIKLMLFLYQEIE